MMVCKKLNRAITDEFCHQVKFKSTLITFAVADRSSDGFGVVLPGLKYNFHLTGVVPSQVPSGVAFRFSMFTGTFRMYDKLFVRENLSFCLVLLFLNNIQIDVSSPKEKSQPASR